MSYNIAELQQLTRQAGWPESLVEKAGTIWYYESSGIACAHNPNGEDSWGLAQINWPYHREYDKNRLCEPIYNLQAAYAIYKKEGWGAWYNSNNKYNSDLRGYATQGRKIYASGSQVLVTPAMITDNNTVNYQTDQTSAVGVGDMSTYLSLFGVAIIVGLLIRR